MPSIFADFSKLTQLTSALSDPSKIIVTFDNIREKIESARKADIGQRFIDQADGTGKQWAGLAPSTVKDRIKKGFPGSSPILIRTGKLRDAAINANIQTGISSDASFYTATIEDADIAKIANILQKGSSKNNLPARVFFDISPTFSDKVKELFAEAQTNRIKELFSGQLVSSFLK